MTPIRLSYINPVEKAEAAVKMIGIARARAGGDAFLASLCDDAQARAMIILDNMGSKEQKAQTERLGELDTKRDDLLRALYYRLKGDSFMITEPARVEAAVAILGEVFDHRMQAVSMPLLKETAWIRERLGALGGALAPHVTTLGLTGLVTSIGEANDAFSAAYENRSSARGDLPKAIMTFVPDLNNALTLLCSYIEARFSPEDRDAAFDPMMKVTRKRTSLPQEPETPAP
ncbi:hypothetical protein KKF84_06705 [Myxococcota bacterium]|nr:hypothetical protein [Myxococcota bacterium]